MQLIPYIHSSLRLLACLLLPATVIAEQFQITVVTGHEQDARWVRHLNETFIPATDRALLGTGHTIQWVNGYGGDIAPVGGALEAMEDGRAELGIVLAHYEPDKLAEHNVTWFTPFVSLDPATTSDLIDSLIRNNSNMQLGWQENGVQYLGGGFALDDHLLVTTFPVNSINDLKGRKIGAANAVLEWLGGTGAAALTAEMDTFYEELTAGVYDGVIAPATLALENRLHEQAAYLTKVGFGAPYLGGIAANRNWYRNLPVEIQGALKLAAEAQRLAYHEDLDLESTTAIATMQSKGAMVTTLPEVERIRWATGMPNIAKAWANRLNDMGKPGSTILQLYMNTARDAGTLPLRLWDQH